MPYCPKCDMEFVDGITVCSDCGGPLMESEEAYREQMIREETLRRKKEEQEREALASEGIRWNTETGDLSPEPAGKPSGSYTGIYQKKSQRYHDLKSSALAFASVGSLILAGAILFWLNVVNLSMDGVGGVLFKAVLTALGIGALTAAFLSMKTANGMKQEIEEEEQASRQLIQWFLSAHSAEDIDGRIREEGGNPGPEEWSLKRYDLIQDLLITKKDLPDQAYAESLAEEIYEVLFDGE